MQVELVEITRHNLAELLALVEEGSGVAAAALKNLDVDLERVRLGAERLVTQGTSPVVKGQMPFTPAMKRVLELSLAEASDLGHTYIGTEHLLLGLIREGQGIAAQALRNLDVDLVELREEVQGLLGDSDEEPAPRTPTAYGLRNAAAQPVTMTPRGTTPSPRSSAG